MMNIVDITTKSGLPDYRHFLCIKCDWKFYSQYFCLSGTFKHLPQCPMCGASDEDFNNYAKLCRFN